MILTGQDDVEGGAEIAVATLLSGRAEVGLRLVVGSLLEPDAGEEDEVASTLLSSRE